MANCLLDTNVLIGILRGDHKLSELVDSLNCAIDTTVYAELIQGAKNKSDVEKSKSRDFRFINGLTLIVPNSETL